MNVSGLFLNFPCIIWRCAFNVFYINITDRNMSSEVDYAKLMRSHVCLICYTLHVLDLFNKIHFFTVTIKQITSLKIISKRQRKVSLKQMWYSRLGIYIFFSYISFSYNVVILHNRQGRHFSFFLGVARVGRRAKRTNFFSLFCRYF